MRKLALTPLLLLLIFTFMVVISACAGWDPNRAQKEETAVEMTIAKFKKADSTMAIYFDNAYGYAVFPTVGKGGYVLGGGYGRGMVYEQGEFIGHSRIINLTVGAQIGGQSYSEIIFFKDKASLEGFKAGNFEFAAQASAVFVTEGVSKDHHYSSGVAVFTMPKAGAMAEATIGGQKFSFEPK
jgi:lipid-binding SYLF domain-containing protein